MRRVGILFWRALLLRCPACGRGRLFISWLRMRSYCPACELKLERDEGYFTGAMAFNLIAAELLFVLGFVAILLLTWPHPPWDLLTYGGPIFMVILPVVFYPFSKTLWLSFDLLFRPVGQNEGRARPPARLPRD